MSGSRTDAALGPGRVRIDIAREATRQRLFGREKTTARIGRFPVLRHLGSGGMGAVFVARDEQLDRRVAVKLLQHEVDETARARVLREAQAMARLRHPNVVQVYEVGEHDDGLYIAMEFVEGTTLAQWQRAERRPWRELVAAYVQAGRGLAAAHAAGLVHRDFKPHNAIVETRADRMTVRVLDFGLARQGGGDARRDARSIEAAVEQALALDTPLTTTGAIVGTPAYMAPEQISGSAVDARADQFSFCVSLWEALHGERPFAGADTRTLFTAVQAGDRRPAPRSEVSRHVVAALERGLQAEPAARWPDLDALLRALESDPAARRRRWLSIAAGGTLLVAGGAALQGLTADEGAQCRGASEHLADVWDDARRGALQSAMLDTTLPYADTTWNHTRASLDRWAEGWTAMHTAVCEATTVRGEQSARVMDLRMACLMRARAEVAAATDVLIEAGPGTVDNAHDVVAGLPLLTRCEDIERLERAQPTPDGMEADAVDAIRSDLAESRARRKAGQYDAALRVVENARSKLEGLAFEPVRAEVSFELGAVFDKLGRFPEAEEALRRARADAARTRQWNLVRDATAQLMWVLGGQQTRYAEALTLRDLVAGLNETPDERAQLRTYLGEILRAKGKPVEAEAEHRAALELWATSPDPRPEAIARGHNNLALDLSAQGRYAEADTEQRIAIELMAEALGTDHPDVAMGRSNLGESLRVRGEYAQAEAEHRAAIASLTRSLGKNHRRVAAARTNLALALYGQGRYAEAEIEQRAIVIALEAALGEDIDVAGAHNNLAAVLYAQEKYTEVLEQVRIALRLKEKLLGPDHPDVAQSRANLGGVLRSLGRLDEAEPELRAALEVQQRTLPATHPDLAMSYTGLGALLQWKGDHEGAEAFYRDALEAITADRGAHHPDAAKARTNIANMLFEQGRLAQAEAEHRTALADKEAGLSPEHPEVGDSSFQLGRTLLRRGRRTEGIARLERAYEIHGRGESPPRALAETAFELARALWATRSQRARARDLGGQAAEIYERVEASEQLAEVERWLAQRR